ncbi:hypothetical protein BT63DRAFT_302105 [Microthyrium microscopicum]|uniref:Uncharacterized protein n=1 Tax=Microthyrium microscopicum TaxID=703497 RepID=A0A6A6U9P2_9PEZI|nr:hypothetical protein BT63DRAFT_302105 [Microthyrium microscopicum]
MAFWRRMINISGGKHLATALSIHFAFFVGTYLGHWSSHPRQGKRTVGTPFFTIIGPSVHVLSIMYNFITGLAEKPALNSLPLDAYSKLQGSRTNQISKISYQNLEFQNKSLAKKQQEPFRNSNAPAYSSFLHSRYCLDLIGHHRWRRSTFPFQPICSPNSAFLDFNTSPQRGRGVPYTDCTDISNLQTVSTCQSALLAQV